MRVYIGFDAREVPAYQVAVRSLVERSSIRVEVVPLLLPHLQALGIYRRPHYRKDGVLWCAISDAPMSTEFANSRFFVHHLERRVHGRAGWALFVDGDFLFRDDVERLIVRADPRFAIMVAKHDQSTLRESVKMDGQPQTAYARKNWSSAMLWNLGHPAHERLTLDVLNTWPGRDLHAFRWLEDKEIGEFPISWNWLEGYSDPSINPRAVHFTRGIPLMPGYENAAYAGEWQETLARISGV